MSAPSSPHRPATSNSGAAPVSGRSNTNTNQLNTSQHSNSQHHRAGSAAHHFRSAHHSVSREKILTVEELVSEFGEPLVKRAAKIHGATFAELRPEGTLRTLQGVHEGSAAAKTAANNSKNRSGSSRRAASAGGGGGGSGSDGSRSPDRRGRRSQSPHNNDDEQQQQQQQQHDNDDDSPLSAVSQSQHHVKPMTRDEFFEAKRTAAWAVAEEECQRLLSAVKGECEALSKRERDKNKAAALAENRLEHIRQAHDERMKREKGQFAERLKKSIESTRAVMERVKHEGEDALKRFYEEQEREEEEKTRSVEAFRQWQLEMKQRAERERKAQEERDKKRAEERRLQHWREEQAEKHQFEIQEHAAVQRHRQMSAKSRAGSRRYDAAISVRQQQRKEQKEDKMQAAVDRLHELEEQERNAHERYKTYQQYKQQRGHETSAHVRQVQKRAKRLEEERRRAAEERHMHEEERMRQWKSNYQQQRKQKRHQFDDERKNEEEAYKRAMAAEDDRKQRAAVVLQWLDARSQQQLTVLDQQRAVKQYEQHVANAAMKRRADRAKRALELRNEQVHEEWVAKMENGNARTQQRAEMAKRSRLEKERLSVMAERMRWMAACGQKVDTAPIDQVLKSIEADNQHERSQSRQQQQK